MERLDLRINDLRRALSTLEDIIKEPSTIIVRDATIQRFEYTFESLWKFIKEYLKVREGIVANSPKASFRGLFSVGMLTEDETAQCLEMTDRRNDTSHTYKETVAEIIHNKIMTAYVGLIRSIVDKF